MVCLFFSGPAIVGQIKLTGRVLDGDSEVPLANVNIVVEGSPRGTITDASGHFNLDLPTGTYRLRFHHIGYAEHVEEIILDSAVALTIRLEEIDHEGETITISSTRLSRTIELQHLFESRKPLRHSPIPLRTVVDGTRLQPDFREIYAPVDGFVANGGIKVRF
jgi:hypothetical protein